MQSSNRVFVIGGTGFLGYHTIREFLGHDWRVTALGLPPAPPEELFPPGVDLILSDVDKTSDVELLEFMREHKALVFAAGLDDRYTSKKPAYAKFYHANVEVPLRILHLAHKAGIQRAVVLGSYFSHFNRLMPSLDLAERHPYIRSRVEQEKVVTSIPGLDVNVLELPYIFGSMPFPGWKSLWNPLVKYIRFSKYIVYMKGGTACISARTVGRAAFAAVEPGVAGQFYPIGQENLDWTEMISRLAAADGRSPRVFTIPGWLLKIGLFAFWLAHKMQGQEGGLDPRFFAPLQAAHTFLDPELSRQALGYELDDLDLAFKDTISACPMKKNKVLLGIILSTVMAVLLPGICNII